MVIVSVAPADPLAMAASTSSPLEQPSLIAISTAE